MSESEPSTLAEGEVSVAHDPMREMRLLLYALLAAVLLVSASLNVFMYRQNNRSQLELNNANSQIAAIEQNPTLQQNRNAMANLLNDLASQASAHPEVQQILARYNLSVQQTPPPAQQPAPPAAAPVTK
jgi:hypothetical protein